MEKQAVFQILKEMLFLEDEYDFILREFVETIEYEFFSIMAMDFILNDWVKFVEKRAYIPGEIFMDSPDYILLDMIHNVNCLSYN